MLAYVGLVTITTHFQKRLFHSHNAKLLALDAKHKRLLHVQRGRPLSIPQRKPNFHQEAISLHGSGGASRPFSAEPKMYVRHRGLGGLGLLGFASHVDCCPEVCVAGSSLLTLVMQHHQPSLQVISHHVLYCLIVTTLTQLTPRAPACYPP